MSEPVFILGVPRSGTTLLRAILDSHSGIACGPETPWLGGHQARSVMSLWRALREEPWGYCQSFGMGKEVPTAAARGFVATLMERYAAARGKRRWAEKTPDNALYVDFLRELFPGARFVHLVRDGLDVAMSTSVVAPHRKGISEFLESRIGFGPEAPAAPNTPFAALLRWRHWNNLIERSLEGVDHWRVSYERLVAEPERTMRGVMEFVGEPFEASMLEYARARHDYPDWEWGSADVRARGGITADRVGRARRELMPDTFAMLEPMSRESVVDPGEFGGGVVAGSQTLARDVNVFAAGMEVDPLGEVDAGALAWLWKRGVAGSWRGRTVRARVRPGNPLVWILALQGADVVVEEELSEPLSRLARGLRVSVRPGVVSGGPVVSLGGGRAHLAV